MGEDEKTERVSAARLNLLRDCPRCFWLELKQGIKRPSAGFPTLPARFDRIIQGYCQPYRDTHELPPLLKETGLEGWLIKATIKPWRDPETGLILSGRLDECLETPAEGFAPLDHKTRGYAPSSPNLNPNYELQLDVYSVLLQGNVTVKLWSGMADFDETEGGVVTVYLRDFDGSGYVELGSDTFVDPTWQGGSPSWVLKTFTFSVGPHTLEPGHSLELKVIVEGSSDDDMWFAYDTASYKSRVNVPN
jgi:hypothetical protein